MTKVSGGSGNSSLFDVNHVNDDPTVNVNSINSEASKLLMKAADQRDPLDPDDPDDPNDPANVAQQEQKFIATLNENAAAQNDVTAGTNTGVAASANHQVLAATKDSFGASGDHAQNTALASIQSSTLDAPTQRVAGLQNLNIRDFDSSKRV